MSRSGYSDDWDDLASGRYRGMVASASRGRRGQKFFRDLLAALNAMPEKRLIENELIKQETGDVCALGALGMARGLDMSKLDPEDPETVARTFDVAECLARETAYMNDEGWDESPEMRWNRMRRWVVANIQAGA